uniref:Uncharacterized protein n=1 Tax=Arundo donax TaxID=35708 RepID=A0A0A9FH23_ARUDO
MTLQHNHWNRKSLSMIPWRRTRWWPMVPLWVSQRTKEQSVARVLRCSSVISALKWLLSRWSLLAVIFFAGLVYISGCMSTPVIRSALSAKGR